MSLLGLPPYLVLEWTGNMASKVNGHAYPVTLTQHVVKTVIIALWLAALFLVRARHRRRERAIYLALQSENARVRVAMNDELEVRVPLEQDEAEPYPEVEADVAKQRRANRPPASRR